VLIAAGIMAASLVLLGAVVVEVGQWLSHRRHLQVRTDAAVLAGAQELAACFNIGINGVTEQSVDQAAENAANDYGGITSNKNLQNLDQTSAAEQNFMSFQSDTYPSAGTPNPARNLHNECFNTDGSANLMLDAKMSQALIPGIFSFSPLETVHGWARAQLQEIQSLIPTMPLAIPDVRPHQVAVTFVNDTTGAALTNCPNGCVFQLTGPTQSGQLNVWGGNATIPAAAMAVAPSNIGMRVGIGSQVGSCAGVNQTGTYTCYDYSTTGQASTRGIIDLRAYNPVVVGAPLAPVLRAVTPTTCSGTPDFSIYQATAGTCTAGVTATIDFGPTGPPAGVLVRATVNGQGLVMTRTPNTNTWVSDATAPPLPIEGGRYPVTMAWCAPPTNCSNRNNFTSFNAGNPVQQVFSGSDGSSSILPGGPIFAASVLDNSDGSALYSFRTDQSASLAITIGLSGGAHLPVRCPNSGPGATYNCATDPPLLLRFTTGSGNDSQTYAVDCGTIPGHTGGNLYQQIHYGCANPFSLNLPDVCPDPANPTPPDCAPVQTGAATGQVQQGMNDRFAPNGQCLPNNWPAPPADDQRKVTLIITDFSAFSGSGNTTVPVVTFASFYVTGWDGAVSGCTGKNEPAPPTDTTNGQGSNIWGHYMQDVNLSSTPSGRACLPGITPCAIALTR
jgi:hypothetical protein